MKSRITGISKINVYISIIVFLLNCSALFSQREAELPDSIKQKIGSSNYSERHKGYVKAFIYYNRVIPSKTVGISENALKEARENKDRKGEAELLLLIGISYHAQSEYKPALDYYNQSHEIYKELKDQVGIGESLTRIGMIYNVKGEYEKALNYSLNAVAILEKENDKKALAQVYNQIGIIYYIINDIPKAKEILNKSLSISNSYDEPRVLAVTHEHLGVIYIKTEEYDKALFHVKKTLELRLKNNDHTGAAGSYENLAIIYRNLKKYDEALKYYSKSLEIKKQINNRRGIASTYSGMGVSYYKMGKTAEGINYIKEAYNIRKEIGDRRGIVASLNQLADIYSEQGDFKNALAYYRLSKEYNDSLMNEQKNKAIAEYQETFQREKRESEIKLLQQENTIHRNVRNYLLIITLLLAAIVVFGYFAYRSKRKMAAMLAAHNAEISMQKIELQDLNNKLQNLVVTRDKFFSIIAHDLKSPFQGFLGLTKIISEQARNLSSDELAVLGSNMHKTADNLFTLLKNLLDWAKMQRGMLSYEPQKRLLNDMISDCIQPMKERIIQKEITLNNNVSGSELVWADENMINSVIQNLLSNAVKFTQRGGEITIETQKLEDEVIVSVIDNGIGMDDDLLKKLFIPGERTGSKGTEGELSTGLGLLLCKEFIEKHGGKIWVESEPGKGSSFHFTLKVA